MIRPADLELLACPDCAGEGLAPRDARVEGGAVVSGALECAKCRSAFPIESGIPWLLPAALIGGRRHGFEGFPEEWRRWGEGLEGFRGWRARKAGDGDGAASRSEVRVAEMRRDAFAAWCGGVRGRALEAACGDGRLRGARGFRSREYWGIDPMPIEGTGYDFPFVAGVGERLPFRSGSFEAVLVKDSLHHFQDPGGFFDEARRVTSSGGSLLVCQGIEGGPAAPGAGERAALLLRRARTALRLALGGEFAELKARAMKSGGPGEAENVGHYLWRIRREDLELEVSRRYEIVDSRMDGNVVYLRART
ncbi:MAG: methyltransferase domain-containing protein [Acidobacteria bacterium]|nr:methyltransferase domain-containing protein [Acidobacteriota bacterium]